jgi:hypothetical protein
MVEIFRESMSSEALGTRVARMVAELESQAGADAGTAAAPAAQRRVASRG